MRNRAVTLKHQTKKGNHDLLAESQDSEREVKDPYD
jgi:hypothetical protein